AVLREHGDFRAVNRFALLNALDKHLARAVGVAFHEQAEIGDEDEAPLVNRAVRAAAVPVFEGIFIIIFAPIEPHPLHQSLVHTWKVVFVHLFSVVFFLVFVFFFFLGFGILRLGFITRLHAFKPEEIHAARGIGISGIGGL